MRKSLKLLIMIIIASLIFFSLTVNASPGHRGGVDDEDNDESFFKMLSNIIDDIANLPGTIAQMIGSFISSFTEMLAREMLSGINWTIIEMFSKLENALTDVNLDLNDNIITNIFNILRPTSSTFAVLFLIIQITKSAATFEALDITRTMKYSLFFVLSIFVIDNSLNILNLIVKGFGQLTSRVLNLGFGSGGLADYIKNTGFSNVGDSLASIILAIVLIWLVYFMALSMYITLAIRSIEIMIMASASGLFASTLASDATIDVFKSFIKSFIATVSSTLFMAIGFALFTSIIKIQFITGDYAYVDVVIKLTALTTYCIRTPQTIRNILGHGSPSVNAISAVKSILF